MLPMDRLRLKYERQQRLMVDFGGRFEGNQESIYAYDMMIAIAIVLLRNTEFRARSQYLFRQNLIDIVILGSRTQLLDKITE
jgi:hypothetical protein